MANNKMDEHRSEGSEGDFADCYDVHNIWMIQSSHSGRLFQKANALLRHRITHLINSFWYNNFHFPLSFQAFPFIFPFITGEFVSAKGN